MRLVSNCVCSLNESREQGVNCVASPWYLMRTDMYYVLFLSAGYPLHDICVCVCARGMYIYVRCMHRRGLCMYMYIMHARYRGIYNYTYNYIYMHAYISRCLRMRDM